MRSAPARSSADPRRFSAALRLAALSLACLLALLALAWLTTVLRIGADADVIEARLVAGGPLRHWSGVERADIVPAGSHGRLDRDAAGLVASTDDGLIELSLNTRGWPLHGANIGALTATIDSAEPIDVAWFGYGGGAGDQRIDAEPRRAAPNTAGEHRYCAERTPAVANTPLHALRLRITSTQPTFRIRLRDAAVFVQSRCDGNETPLGEVNGTALESLAASPEALLRQRADLIEVGAVWVEPATGAPNARPASTLTRTTTFWVWLTGLATLVGCLVAMRSSEPTRRLAPLLVLAPVPFLLASSAMSAGFRADVHIALFLALLAAALIAFRTPRPRLVGSGSAWREAALGVAAGALLLAAAALGRDGWAGLRFPAEAFSSLAVLRYTGWALLQQWILVAALLPALSALVGARAAIPATAIAFAALHMPNAALMVLTAIAGLGFAWHARRHRSLLPLAIAHALLATLAIGWLTPDPLRNAEVGGRYFLEALRLP